MNNIFSIGDRVAVNPYGQYAYQDLNTNGAKIKDHSDNYNFRWGTGPFIYNEKDIIPHDGE